MNKINLFLTKMKLTTTNLIGNHSLSKKNKILPIFIFSIVMIVFICFMIFGNDVLNNKLENSESIKKDKLREYQEQRLAETAAYTILNNYLDTDGTITMAWEGETPYAIHVSKATVFSDHIESEFTLDDPNAKKYVSASVTAPGACVYRVYEKETGTIIYDSANGFIHEALTEPFKDPFNEISSMVSSIRLDENKKGTTKYYVKFDGNPNEYEVIIDKEGNLKSMIDKTCNIDMLKNVLTMNQKK